MFLVKMITGRMSRKSPDSPPTTTNEETEEYVNVHEELGSIRKKAGLEELEIPFQARKLPFCHGYLPALEANHLLIRSGDFLIRFLEDNNKVRVVVSVGLTSTQSYKYRELEEEGREQEEKWKAERAREGGEPFRETIAVNVRHMMVEEEDKLGCTIDEETFFPCLYSLLAYYMFVKREGPQDFNLRNPINRQYGSFRLTEINIVRILNNGAYGQVALADITHPAFEQDKAAVKTVKQDLPEWRELEEKLIKEGRVSTPLDNDNVLRTLGFCYDTKPVQLLFEYCPGGALSKFLVAKSEKMSNLALARLCLDAARGLDYIHEVGFLHRDVSARNCLLDENGTVKIAGFGLSIKTCYYEVWHPEKLPIRYLAPECFNDFQFIAETDVYAFGHILCEVFNQGQLPYAGMSGEQARTEILAGKAPSMHGRAPEALRLYVGGRLLAYHTVYRPPMHQVVHFLETLISCLEKHEPEEEGKDEFPMEADNDEAMQPNQATEDVYELLDPGNRFDIY
ncbi:unnamed protein product [Caenorhabditis auriculariae]|uniref:Tyrosine-protein kinase n=1 Tax=Caenorhabditis auriculariae TaxID=2777116 RepID=A0A8S1HHZ6_9PELO|nr:unnamed protein product [Caenorhabditis auriculariae]